MLFSVGIHAPAASAQSMLSSQPVTSQISKPQLFWAVPAFSLQDQDQHTLRQKDLLGQVWVASFIYTSCPDVCPLITRQMAALRDALATSNLLGDSVRLVSFSVDPRRDTPSVLRRYAQDFDAENVQEWSFVTGKPAQMLQLLTEGFHLIVEPNVQAVSGEQSQTHSAATDEIAHSNRAMVIDRCGQVRAIHPVLDPERFRQLVTDLNSVVQEASDCAATVG
ncbi:SCO family protein [Acaryochloris thomasi]|nr:SCO family protein [Acaryochloris thomasi]